MYILYILGSMLEPAMGRLRFGVIYGVSLLTGSLGALIVSPHVATVGASGAVFGIMGAAAVEMRARQIPVMQSGVGGLILINLVISFTLPGISWGGHIGGLIGGALAALILQEGDRRRAQSLALAACGLIAVGAVVGLDRDLEGDRIAGLDQPVPAERAAELSSTSSMALSGGGGSSKRAG